MLPRKPPLVRLAPTAEPPPLSAQMRPILCSRVQLLRREQGIELDLVWQFAEIEPEAGARMAALIELSDGSRDLGSLQHAIAGCDADTIAADAQVLYEL